MTEHIFNAKRAKSLLWRAAGAGAVALLAAFTTDTSWTNSQLLAGIVALLVNELTKALNNWLTEYV